MAYKPDNLGAMAQPITTNKIELAQQDGNYTTEDAQKYLKERVEDLGTIKDISVSSAKQGIAMGKAKWYSIQRWSAEKELTRKRNMLKKRLSELSGIELESLTPDKEEELISLYKDDEPLQSWIGLVKDQKDFYNKSQEKIDSIMGYYNLIEEEQLKMIDNINGGILKNTLPFASDVITGLSDWTNAAKQIGIATAVALSSPAIATGAAAIGLGKVGTMVAQKGIEYGLNAVDNYLTMEQEHELQNPDADPLTTKEKVYGTVIGSVVDIGIDGGMYALKKGFKKLKTIKTPDEINKTVKSQVLKNENIPLNNTSAKEVAKQVYDVEHGKGSANEDLFRMNVKNNPDMVYNYALDPQNQHQNIYDNIFNGNIPEEYGIYYKIDDSSIVKYDTTPNRIVPTTNEYEYIDADIKVSNLDADVLSSDTVKYKIDNGIPIDERISPTYQIKKSSSLDDVRIYDIEESSNKYIQSSNYAMSEAKLKESDNGSFAKVVNGSETIFMYKDGDNIIKIIQDTNYINRPVKHKNNILTDHFVIRRLKDNLHSRVEVVDANGNIKSIYGMEKETYIGKYKRLSLINNLTKSINILAEDISNNKIQIDENSFEARGNLGRTIANLCDTFAISEIQHTQNNIVSHNFKEFKRLMQDPDTGTIFFKDIEDMLNHTDKDALSEFFVTGKVTKKIFNKDFPNEELVAKQLEQWINGLIDNNTFIFGYKNKMNVGIDMTLQDNIDKYGRIFKLDNEGNIQYNTDKGAFFEGMTDDDIEYKILDMLINPEKIDLGNEKAISDRNILYQIFENFTADRQNAIAIKRVFEKSNINMDMLYEFGIIQTNETGDIIAPIGNFVQGVSNIIKEISNPKTKYNVDELKNILKTFGNNFDVNKKYIPSQDGSVGSNLFDFILHNKNNSMIDIKEFHNILSPIINDLDINISNKINKILPLIQEKNINLQVNKIDSSNVNKIISILNKWKSKMSKENGANSYISTQQYKDELKQLQELSRKVNIDDEHIKNISNLENINEAIYTGDITFDNLSNKFEPIVNEIEANAQIYTDIQDNIDGIKNLIGRKRNIENIISSNEFKEQVGAIVDSLKKQGIPNDVIQKLYSTDVKELKASIKTIDNFLNEHSKKRNILLKNIQELELLKTPKDVEEYIKHTRNRKKIKSLLDSMETLGANKDTIEDIRDFINYNGKEFDYKLDKNNIISSIDNVLNYANDFMEQLDITNYGKKRNAYNKLYTRYNQMKNIIKDKTPKGSIQFLKSKDIEAIYNDIIKYSEIVGDVPEDIKQYKDILVSIQKTLGDIQDSRKNSPFRKLNKDFVDGYKAITSKARQKFGRLESVINKRRWFEDKKWYKQTKGITDEQLELPKVMKILFEDFEDIDDIPEGIAEQYIEPEKMEMFKNLYEYAKSKFRGNEIFDDDNNLIQSTPLTIDQFAVVYAKFLEELSDTTTANKKQSIEALKVFFNDEDDMIDFFTNRKNDYGVGYVHNNRNVLKIYNESNALQMADLEVLGMDRRTFSRKLNFYNKDVQWALKKNALKVTEDILKETKDGIELKPKTIKKDLNTETKSLMKAISDYIMRPVDPDRYTEGLQKTLSNSYDKYINNTIDLLYPIILNCTGLMEVMFNPMFALRRSSWVDARGKMFGYKTSNRLLGNARMAGLSVGRGILQGVITAPSIVVNGTLGIVNAISTLDRYIGVQNLINRNLNTNVDLRVHNTGLEFTTKILNSLSGGDEATLSALLDMQMTKRTLKGKVDYVNPKNLPFKNNKMNYIRTAFGEAFDMFKEQAMNIQEVADMSRGIHSSITARDLMEEFLIKSFDDLPENIISTLRNFGITKDNYLKFTNTLKNISPDGKTFKGVYLMDLLGQIPNAENGMLTEISQLLQSQDIDMLSSIQGLTNYFFDNAFVLNKQLKYSEKGKSAMNRLAFALRHSTIGIGLEDLSNILEEKTSSGLYKSKLSRFNRYDSKLDIAKNMMINGATALPFFLASTVILSQGGNLLDDMFRKPEKTKQDLADSMTRWTIFKNRILDDENFAKGVFNGLSYLATNIFLPSVGNALPISSLFSGGNILTTMKPYMADGYLAIQKLINSPTTVDIDKVNATLRALSPDVKYNEIDHMNEGRILPMANFLLSVAFVRSFAKIPAGWYKAWTNKDDKTLETKQRKKFINRDATIEWKREAALQWDKIYSKNGINEKVRVDDENEDKEKYFDLPDDTLVPIPDKFEDLNDEGKKALGEYVFDVLNTIQEEVIPTEYSANINKINAINEWGNKNELIDEDTYKNKKASIYKDMKLDDMINELTPQYKIAFKTIDKNMGDMTDIQKDELHLQMLKDVNNGAEAGDLMEKYNNPQQNNQKSKSNKKTKYSTFDDLPFQYKIYYKAMKKQGYNLSEQDIINFANTSKTIPKINEGITFDIEDNILQSNEETRVEEQLIEEQPLEEQNINIEETNIEEPNIDIESPNAKIKDNNVEIKSSNNEIKGSSNLNKLEDENNFYKNEDDLINTSLKSEKFKQLNIQKVEELIKFDTPKDEKDYYQKLANEISSNPIQIIDELTENNTIDKEEKENTTLKSIKDSTINDTNKLVDNIDKLWGTLKNKYNVTADNVSKLISELDKPTPKKDMIQPEQIKNKNDYNKFVAEQIVDSPILNNEYKDDIKEKDLKDLDKPKEDENKKLNIKNIIKDKENTKEKSSLKTIDKAQVKEEDNPRSKALKNIKEVLKGKAKKKNAGVISINDYKELVNVDELPKQVKIAIEEFNKNPVTGDKNVKEYFKDAGFGSLNPNNNWCAAFLTSTYGKAGYKLNKKTVGAQAFAANGKDVSMEDGKVGDTLVFRNRDKNGKRTWTGHVNMIAYKDDDIIIAIGGNQSGTDSKERDGDKNTINFKVYSVKGLKNKMEKQDLSIIRVSNQDAQKPKKTKTK